MSRSWCLLHFVSVSTQNIAEGKPIVRKCPVVGRCECECDSHGTFIRSLPLLLLLGWMVHLAVNRSRGGIKNRYLRKEIEACRKVRLAHKNVLYH